MTQAIASLPSVNEVTLVRLAREIAMDIRSVEDVLETFKVSLDQWDSIQRHPKFIQLLESEIATWETALNTHERVKVKAAATVEEWLPELNARIHDRNESLNAKIEAGKLLSRLAGMGLTNASVAEAGEKFSVTINLGGDNQIKFEKQGMKTIDGEVLDD